MRIASGARETVESHATQVRSTSGSSAVRASRHSVFGVGFVLVLTTVYFLIPVWWLVVAATKSNSALLNSPALGFEELNLVANIEKVFATQGGIYPLWLANSLLYSMVGGLGATLMGAACGYVLAKYSFRGKGAIFAFIMAGVLLPSTLLTVPLYLMFARIGLTNSYLAVLIPAMVSPFAVYLSRIYAAASVPDEVIEAARVDGAGEVRIFATMALPIMSPALVTVFLFTFVAIWNNFFLPLIMLSDTRFFPVTLGIYGWFADPARLTYDIVLTGSLIAILPLVIAFLSLQRFWRAGLTAGGVKL